MSVVVKKLLPAEADIIRVAEWHDDQQPGLGEDFIRSVDLVIDSLATDALLHRIRFADIRRAGVKRFWRHGVFYFVWQDEVIVLAVFHGSRHPKWLQERRQES